MWPVGVFTIFEKRLTVPFTNLIAVPAVRAVRGDCELVYTVLGGYCLKDDVTLVMKRPSQALHLNPSTAGNAWVCIQHCGYWCHKIHLPKWQFNWPIGQLGDMLIPADWFNIKMSKYQYRNFKDKPVSQLSHIYNKNPFAGKTASGSGHRNFGCLGTWFCYQLIAKPGNKTAPPPYPYTEGQ